MAKWFHFITLILAINMQGSPLESLTASLKELAVIQSIEITIEIVSYLQELSGDLDENLFVCNHPELLLIKTPQDAARAIQRLFPEYVKDPISGNSFYYNVIVDGRTRDFTFDVFYEEYINSISENLLHKNKKKHQLASLYFDVAIFLYNLLIYPILRKAEYRYAYAHSGTLAEQFDTYLYKAIQDPSARTECNEIAQKVLDGTQKTMKSLWFRPDNKRPALLTGFKKISLPDEHKAVFEKYRYLSNPSILWYLFAPAEMQERGYQEVFKDYPAIVELLSYTPF